MKLNCNAFAVALLLGAATAVKAGPQEVATAAGCQVCHAADRQMLGPSYQAIADRYRDEEDAPDRLLTALREGANGVWGKVPMPPVDPGAVSDDDLKAVIGWILQHQAVSGGSH